MIGAEPHPMPEVQARTVLVVEDDALIRIVTADDLRVAGFSVVEARNADEAMEYIRIGNPVDFVFSDVHMPGTMDGIEFARRLAFEFPEIKILLTSGDEPAQSVFAVAPFVTKPCNITDVVTYIHAALADRP